MAKREPGEFKRLDFRVELIDFDNVGAERTFDCPDLYGGFGIYVPHGGRLNISPVEAVFITEGIRDVLTKWIKPKFE